ncbi:hypothetical protein E2C01_076609 [Portunus trituberculatus]|uniref:Uncharacterized protein n=1 Tax=Portunus trituberculatus TaxID=210409 RepID=A0A5B7IK61_PORTR|nr:hypothetical protein [Portunus trituberculatus]
MRKERLAVELSHQVDEKGRLEAEVEAMVRELQAREQQRKHNTDTNAMVSTGHPASLPYYRKSSELILTDLQVRLRPHHMPHTGTVRPSPSNYILYLLAAW